MPFQSKSIQIQSSIVGYIAKCMALVAKGEMRGACRVCDIASLHFHSNHVAILLIKVSVLCNGTSFPLASSLP